MQLNSSVATRSAARGAILGITWLAAMVVLGGCGQKGPLALPGANTPASAASAASAPSTR